MTEKENILKAIAAVATVLATSEILWDRDRQTLEDALRVLQDLKQWNS